MHAHADRPPHHLSFGERRRVALATVLSMRPDVLVLDEPSSNLDPTSRRELAEIVAGLDITVVLVTHDLPYALQLCPRSVVLNCGRVIADDSTAAVLGDDALLAANRLELPFGFDGRLLHLREPGHSPALPSSAAGPCEGQSPTRLSGLDAGADRSRSDAIRRGT